jgi:signal transduction histidine kinase
MRLQHKIALLFTAITATTMLVVTLAIYYFASRNAFLDFQKRLELRANLAARQLQTPDTLTATTRLGEQLLEELPQQSAYYLHLTHGKPDSIPDALTVPDGFFAELAAAGNAHDQKNQVYYHGVKVSTQQGEYWVIVQAVNTYGKEYLSNLIRIKLIGFVLGTLIVLIMGLVFGKRILQPIRALTQQAKEISIQNLNSRLPETNSKDEIANLTATFNNMLDRLQTAFESQNNFVSNASHELSTPLTTIIGEGEWALSRERDAATYQASIQTMLAQAERLSHITKSLLQLAQSGYDKGRQEMRVLRIDEKLIKAKMTVDELYPGNQIQFDFSWLPENPELLTVHGNAQLLQLAFTNVLMNACKYSDNKPVKVALASSDKRIIIVVKDEGIGIPAEELPYIFDPFFRAGNTRNFKGYGIGLPLTRNIMRLHKGDIKVSSKQNEGTIVEMSLPLFAQQGNSSAENV